MMQSRTRSFEEAAHAVTDSTVLLDVDGTLLPDGESDISGPAIAAARDLALRNRVYLASNGKDHQRVERFSRELGIPILPVGVPAGKPARQAIAGVPTDRQFVVIGDKYLTDGLFARAVGGLFIPVARKKSGREPLSVRLSYMLDPVVSWFL